MSTINEQNAQSFINYTGPIPGQSLTNSPDSKQPWELPPQFVNKRQAELYILEELTEAGSPEVGCAGCDPACVQHLLDVTAVDVIDWSVPADHRCKMFQG